MAPENPRNWPSALKKDLYKDFYTDFYGGTFRTPNGTEVYPSIPGRLFRVEERISRVEARLDNIEQAAFNLAGPEFSRELGKRGSNG